MRVLGINAVFHDSSAALVVDGQVVAAAEEERFSRRKHGKRPVPFAAWELPDQAARWCLVHAGLRPQDLDAVAYGFDPALAKAAEDMGLDDPWDHLRIMYAERAPGFLASVLPGLDPGRVRFVAHHVAHAASAGLQAGFPSSAVMALDGRGERASALLGRYDGGRLETVATQDLPHSLGLVYESLTEHLGFLRSSDEYKVMALASYGRPRFLDELRGLLRVTGDGGYVAVPPDWSRWAPPRVDDGTWDGAHADLACSVQARLEEVLVELATWLRQETGESRLTMAGGIALNCVANSRIWREAGFDEVWVQPASGDSGTALGAALQVAADAGDTIAPMTTAALGRGWSDDELAGWLRAAHVPFETPEDLPRQVAAALAQDAVVAWFDGRAEFGPRALGQRSLLAHPGVAENLERLNDVKGREQFRPVAPMVLAEDAAEIFSDGPLPSPYMLFVHRVAEQWRDRVPAVVHVDGTARIQTVDADAQPRLAATLRAFRDLTGLPVVVNTSLNTAGRPMVDDPRDALELFGSAPVDVLVVGPHLVRRASLFAAPRLRAGERVPS
ncbi:carbamoyltransferase family protein [Cellulomonas fimi]|uniref:Carbamoyltransferase n=1 Tax=Cellulomonas fimi (strain ATCC 484 / DSM 20113 / JCM 1341 / CCUG 24087 / LMG 16345 / NBRC 15513 / NCIMB 8980 / NCTC 7547 / NRS-133) TaxID=590998 RepID=F4H5Y6_CELFA|nr:carbamoyltransferase C-terminal domain-containing protein [Cellulomonas fimi]AEE46716.1 Carbamoyltransferase [Cellulomonas fimi ATCC 484]NNH07639.1 carbamoyltransferase [Cellulomonas fimi]VEH33970.1 Predicted carbamoyl transferase, NodU family [Cellulomonas fimi]